MTELSTFTNQCQILLLFHLDRSVVLTCIKAWVNEHAYNGEYVYGHFNNGVTEVKL